MRSLWLALWFLAAVNAAGAAEDWVAAWCSGQQLVEPANRPPAPGLAGNTLREFVHVSLRGSRVRLRFSNSYGSTALELKSVHLALAGEPGAIKTESDKAITFSRTPSATIAAGDERVSDPLDFELPPLGRVAVTIHFGRVPTELTGHPGSRTTSYVQQGDWVSAQTFASSAKTPHWYFLSQLAVVSPNAVAVVVLGDSITDGRGSTTDGNDRWTDALADRLKESRVAVVNQGIGGNAVLAGGLGPTALKRFDRDVLQQPGAKWLFVLEGVNDIGRSGDLEVVTNLLSAYSGFASEAHAHGLKACIATILPFGGSMYDSPAHEAARQAVNQAIRNNRGFDHIFDLDAAVRDASKPSRLQPEFDCGDHLHLNPAGYQRMAQAIDISIFEP
jgi:lysophospholipase L1-like esterase